MSFTAFLLAALVLAITPGPGIAYVVARTVAGGRTEGLASCVGTAIGGLVHVLAAAAGLSLIIAQSATAFSVIKYLGAAYLVYLGIKILRSKPPDLSESEALAALGARRALRDGMVVEALNVKTAMFFLAFLPQFVNSAELILPQVMLLGSICVLLNTLADVLAVFAANRLLDTGLAHAARARLMMSVSGITMIGLGVLLALTRRHT
ncbi:MAG: LysE family translocator [Betaproteobacteria bacterium]|nr:LysE family translocator [Betaproteobacteria bacterium]